MWRSGCGNSSKGDDLERIAELVDFATFRAELERVVPRDPGAKQLDASNNRVAGRC
jgi:hypothetical protein